jgi:hypothetical protein
MRIARARSLSGEKDLFVQKKRLADAELTICREFSMYRPSFRTCASIAALTSVLTSAVAIAQPAESAAPAAASQPWHSQIDRQMQSVLEVYGLLAGTPITQLSPQDARSNSRQKTPPK